MTDSVKIFSQARPVHFGLTDLLFSRRRKIWILVDFIITFVTFNVAIGASPYGSHGHWQQPFIFAGAIFSIVFCFVGTGLGYYDRIRRFSFSNMIINGLFISFLSALVALSFLYFSYYGVYGRWTLFYGATGAYFVTIAVRLPLRWVLRQYPYRYTVFGTSDALKEVEAFTNSNDRYATYYNQIEWDKIFPTGSPTNIANLMQFRVGDIVIARDSLNDPALVDLALNAIQAGCRVIDEISFYGYVFERVPLDQITKAWLLSEGLDHRRRVFSELLKRTFDVIASAAGLIVLSPFLLVIALAIRLTDAGPVIFIQNRVGRFCVPFKMYKFRTMRTPKDGYDNVSGGFTAKHDPRVTWIGKITRPLHLDELPQLFNIFLGHMSIVGPRPEASEFADRVRKQVDLYDVRYLMRPGLTGHAQLNQGYAMDTVEDTKKKLSFDLYYLCKHSLTWDLRIIARTIFLLAKKSR